MRRLMILGCAVGLLAATAAQAATGTDPDDVNGGLDISRSIVRTVEIEPGHFRLRLTAETYEPFDLSGGVGSFYWQLDTWGADAPDYEAYVFGDPKAVPAAPVFCLVKSMHGPFLKDYVTAVVSGNRATCAIPRHDLRVTKPIRWRLAGRQDGVVDRAPDVGWYGG
jgi:hypothetical protein